MTIRYETALYDAIELTTAGQRRIRRAYRLARLAAPVAARWRSWEGVIVALDWDMSGWQRQAVFADGWRAPLGECEVLR